MFYFDDGTDLAYLKSSAGYADYYEDYGWWGNFDIISVEKGYKILLPDATSDALVFEGDLADPVNHPIGLDEGWNWIGYTPQLSHDINNGLFHDDLLFNNNDEKRM